ncbi:MAG: FRG domain-containing protein [Acidobacteriota bacterium]
MTFQQTLERVQDRKKKLADDAKPLWFRGHRLVKWKLRSRQHRRFLDVCERYKVNEDFHILRQDEKTLFLRFKSQACSLLSPNQTSMWSLLLTMQHYGLPTRFLDWTESFSCALYFALKDANGEDAAIFLLSPEQLNTVSAGCEGLVFVDDFGALPTIDFRPYHPCHLPRPEHELKTIAVCTQMVNPRMVAQRSVFTLSGDSFESLETEFGDQLSRRGVLEKIVLPRDTLADARDFLDLIGVTDFTFFPDLHGLAQSCERDTRRLYELADKLFQEPGEIPPE